MMSYGWRGRGAAAAAASLLAPVFYGGGIGGDAIELIKPVSQSLGPRPSLPPARRTIPFTLPTIPAGAVLVRVTVKYSRAI